MPVRGKNIIIIDDSIVRGTTSRQIVQLLRSTGAREIHMRIASPPYAWPCYYGIDTGTKEQLLASGRSIDEIRAFIGADSLEYLSVDALYKASGRTQLCTACFSGEFSLPESCSSLLAISSRSSSSVCPVIPAAWF